MSQIENFELLEYDRSTFRPAGAKEIIPTMSDSTVAITEQLSNIASEFKVLTTEQLNASDFYSQCVDIVDKSNHMAECVRTTMLKLFDDTAARIDTIDKNSKDYTEDIAASEANLTAALGKINDTELKPVSAPSAPVDGGSSAQPANTQPTQTGQSGGGAPAEQAPTTNLDNTNKALDTLTNLNAQADAFLKGDVEATRISSQSQLIDPASISAAITSGAFFAGQGISRVAKSGDYTTPIPITEDTVRSMFEGSGSTITGYEKLENGAIKVTTERKGENGTVKDTYYLPETLTKDSNAVVYFPGGDETYDSGSNVDFRKLVEGYDSITEPIVISSKSYNNIGDMAQNLNNIIEESGGSIGQLTVAGYSAGGLRAVLEANAYQGAHPDTKVQYLGIDPYGMDEIKPADVANLVSSGADFNYIPITGRSVNSVAGYLTNAGVSTDNIYSMSCQDNGVHWQINRDAVTNVIPYIQGYTDSLPSNAYQRMQLNESGTTFDIPVDPITQHQ